MNSLIALAASTLYVSATSLADDDEDEDHEDDAGDETVEDPKPTKTKKTKKAVKKVKKSSKKSEKKSSKAEDKNVVRLKDLAKQAKLTEAVARKKLRDADVPRGEGRWAWELGSKALKTARKALGLA